VTIRKNARRARLSPFGFWLVSCLSLSILFSPVSAWAKEKVLLLSVLREGRPDAKLLKIAQDRLKKAGEELVPSGDLTNTERKCVQQECLLTLAASKGADLVLAGTVQKSKGGNQSLGVLLYDFNKTKAQELSSDCDRCSPDMLSTQLHELFVRALADSRGENSSNAAVAKAQQAEQEKKPVIVLGMTPPKNGTEPVANPGQTDLTTGLKQPFAATTTATQTTTTNSKDPEPLAVVTGGPIPPKPATVEPQPLPPPTVEQPPKPASSSILTLSPKRKVLAGVLGGLALGSLVAGVALTATDGNATGMDCNASSGVPKICVLDNKVPSSIGYVMAGAFTVGTVLTLLWPENKPQVKESSVAEAAK